MKIACFLWCVLISFFSAANSYTVFEENGKVGLKDSQGQVLIPAEYEALGWSNGSFSIIDNVTGYFFNNRWGLISLQNHKVSKAEFDELFPGDGSLIVARKKSNLSLRLSVGCINTAGKEVIPFIYDGLKILSLRAIVFTKIGNQYKYGLIDLANKTLIPQQYQDIKPIGNLRYSVLNFEGKTALFTEDGKQIMPFNIDSLSGFKKNYALLYQGIYQGLIDRDGQIKVDPKYREVIIKDDGSVKVREANEWIFLDGENKLIRKIKADTVTGLSKNLLKVKSANSVQLTDQHFSPVSKTTFSHVGIFEKGKSLYQFDNYFGVVLANGSILIPALYYNLIAGKNFYLANQRIAGKDSWMLLDSLGNKRTEKVYENITILSDDFFAVRSRGFWGALNREGQNVIACAYDSLFQAKGNLIVVKFRGQYGIIDSKEQWIVTPQKNRLVLIDNNRYVESGSPTTFLKSLEGNTIYFSENKLLIHQGYMLEYLPSGTIWKIDMQGVIIDRQVYPEEITEEVFEEAEGYRAIKRNGKYGFIDSRGRLRIANRYEGVQKFSEGLAPAKILGKWGFINQQDNIAVQPTYEEVFPFKNGFAVVKQKGLFGLVDRTGRLILPVRYSKIENLPSKNYRITQDNLLGLADVNGKVLINPKYNSLRELVNGYVVVERQGQYGVVTAQGISTIPLMYDYIDYDAYNNYFLAMKKSEWIEVNFN